MTGKDLIVYILQNNLENEPVIHDGKLLGFLSIEEAAVKMDYGVSSVVACIALGKIPGYELKSGVYIPENSI